MKCLIVEDDFASRSILNRFLEDYFDCDTAVNGEEALQAFKKALEANRPYDLICMDIMMPNMDGQEALRHIREFEQLTGVAPGDEVKTIMTSSLNDPRTIMNSLYVGGAAAYLVKPVTKQRLELELRNMKLIA